MQETMKANGFFPFLAALAPAEAAAEAAACVQTRVLHVAAFMGISLILSLPVVLVVLSLTDRDSLGSILTGETKREAV